MMPNRNWDYRQHKRYVKGIKRVREDRAEHGNSHNCPCFDPEADKGKGAIFDRFAKHPQACSCYMCCNGSWEESHFVPDE